MVTTTQSDGSKTEQMYNAASHLTSVIDAAGNTMTYEYDQVGREKAVVDALGGRTELVYDAIGRLIERTEPRGQKVTFALDNWGRVVEENWLDGGESYRTIVSTYDANDRLLSIDDGESSLSFKYDARSQLTNTTQSYDGPLGSFSAAVNFNYDSTGRPNGNTFLVDGEIVHDTVQTYTPAGNTDSLEFRIPGILTAKAQYAWDAAYQMIAINRSVVLQGGGSSPAAVDTDRAADVLGRPLLISHSINSSTDRFDRVVEQSFVYDTASRLIRSTDAFGVHDYAYDAIGQLAKVTHGNESLPTQNYVFDAAGNPEEFDGRNVTVGSGNRLVDDGEYSYSYDEAGNLTRRVSLTDGSATDYVWDIRDRLIEVRHSDGDGQVVRVVRYAYDPANRRIAEMIAAEGDETSRFFIYDKEDIAVQLADTDGPSGAASASVARQFFHGIGSDQILASFDATALHAAEPTDDEILSALHWYLTDHLGSVRDVVDGHGKTLDSILYDAFGNMLVRTDASVDLPYGFTGRELDVATGLYYYRARYYDPAVGRFLTPDPSGLAAGDTNLYRYVGNNPTSLVDPSGLEAQHPMSGLLDDVANGLKSFRQWSGIERVTDRFVTGALNLVGLGDNATATQAAFTVTGLVSGTLSGRHLENIIRFGSGLAEGAEEAFFDASSIGSDIYNRYHGIQSSDSNLFKAIDTVNSPLDAAFLGISLVVAPFFSFVDFGQKVLSGDPKAAGKSTFTTLPQVAGVSNFFPGRRTRVPNYTRIGKEFFGQPVGSGLRTLLDAPASLGGLLSVARQTIRRRSVAKAALAEGRLNSLIRNSAEFVEELNSKPGRFEKFYVASGRNDRAARNSPYFGKSADDVIASLKGVHPSVKKALKDNSPFGMQLKYVLEKMHNSPGVYNRAIETLSQGRSVAKFDEIGFASKGDIRRLRKLSREFPDHTVGLFGSNGSSVGSLVNQHVLVEALTSGRLSVKSLRKLHPEVDLEALLTGRLLANPTKIGGQFGGSLDYDLGISNGTNFRGLKPFKEIFTDAETKAIKANFPKGSEIDLNYGFFENESLTGASFTNRGRILFQNGKLTGRQESHLYGVDGRVVRDFPDLFAEAGLAQSAQLFNKLDWDRVRPTLPVYATLFAYEVSAGWVGVSDVLGGAAGLNNKTEDGNYVYQFRKAGGYANNFYGEKSAGLFQIGELGSTRSVVTHSSVESLQTADLPKLAETNFQFVIKNVTAPIPNDTPVVGLANVAVNAILDSAWKAWSVSNADAGFERIDIKFENLPGMQIAEARPATNSSTPQIIIDTDGAGFGWFVDATPSTDDEFTSDSIATTRFDLLTVLTHEIGHLLGFGAGFETFDSLIQSAGGTSYVTSGPTRWYLNGSNTELDPTLHSKAVMAATIAPGTRRYPTAEERALIASLAGSLYNTPNRLHQHGDGVANIGFVTLANAHTLAIQTNGIAVGLRNSQFSEEDSIWVTEGTVAFAEQSATLSEANSAVTDLSQTFRLPVATRSLSFTLDATGLRENSDNNANDAFEVALLDAISTTSLIGDLQGLTGSDALLSIQADGRAFLAPEVAIEGVASGDLVDLSQPIDVTIDLANVEPETIATLYFDLIGFGDDSSEVTISNLAFESNLSWHNRSLPQDTNGNGIVTPIDVLLAINELNSRTILGDGSNALPKITDAVGPPPYYDVNNDGLLTPIDVLLVVNYINAAGEGEGPSLSDAPYAIDVINELNQLAHNGWVATQNSAPDIDARDIAFQMEFDDEPGLSPFEEHAEWTEFDSFIEQIAGERQNETADSPWLSEEWDD
jgi:RHS repeat-associated protein